MTRDDSQPMAARVWWRPVGEAEWRLGTVLYCGGDSHARRVMREDARPGLEWKTTVSDRVEQS